MIDLYEMGERLIGERDYGGVVLLLKKASFDGVADDSLVLAFCKGIFQVEGVGAADRFLKEVSEFFVKSGAVFNEMGVVSNTLGRVDEAIDFFMRAISCAEPCQSAAGNCLIVMLNNGLIGADFDLDRFWNAGDQSDSVFIINYATALRMSGRVAESRRILTAEAERNKNNNELLAVVYESLGGVNAELGDHVEAEFCYIKAGELGLDEFRVLASLALLARAKGDCKKSIDLACGALNVNEKENNTSALMYNLLAECFREEDKKNEAWELHQKAMKISPGNQALRYSASLTKRAMGGDLREAWHLYEARWSIPGTGGKSNLPWPEWKGEVVKNGRLLVYGEQGLGDQVYWASVFNDLHAFFDYIVCVCNSKLVSVFSRSFPDIIFVPDLPVSHALVFGVFDFQVAMGSLPAVLRRHDDDFYGKSSSFLLADKARVDSWKYRLEQQSGRMLKVGLAWRSGLRSGERMRYFPSLKSFEPLLNLSGVCFLNLQYGETDEECLQLSEMLGHPFLRFSQIDHFNDIDASLALMAACDLVIAPPTSTAFLAAAAGVPVLQMAPALVDGAQLGRQVSPWMPMLTQIAKKPDEPWSVVVDQLVLIVAQLALERWQTSSADF